MADDLTIANSKAPEKTDFMEMDGLLKFILAIGLSSMPFFLHMQASLVLLSLYLIFVTLVSKIKPRTLLISGTSYCIIVVLPYFFGLLMNGLFYTFSHNEMFAYHQGPYEIFLRLFRLFVIWYVSILYFHTTPMKTVIGLLDKLFTPLKSVGVPVADYLKVVMCIVLELKETGSEVTKSLGESMRSVMGGARGKFKINVKGISQIIVSLIVNSFEKLDKIESFVEQVKPEDLYSYRFKLSKSDAIAVMSFTLMTCLVVMVEKGYWF